MRRFFNLLLALAIVAGSILLAAFLISLAPEPEQRELPSPLPFVTTAPVFAGSGSIPVFGAGTVRPSAEIDIAPQVGGRVVWVDPALRSGGRIDAGQTMFRIEEADYVNRLREAEAALADRRVAMLEAEEEAAIARDELERYTERQGIRRLMSKQVRLRCANRNSRRRARRSNARRPGSQTRIWRFRAPASTRPSTASYATSRWTWVSSSRRASRWAACSQPTKSRSSCRLPTPTLR